MLRRFGFIAALICVVAASGAEADDGQKDGLSATVFAGGCFWCVESDFDKLDGVVDTLSGYTGGRADNPTYGDVTSGGTGHYEAVRITYDPAKVSYETLVTYFFRLVDPTDPDGQFCDRGSSYRTAIFAANAEEREIAERLKAEAAAELSAEVVTPVLDTGPFYPAEDYHQDYYVKNPVRYKYYRFACGRDRRVQSLWGDGAKTPRS